MTARRMVRARRRLATGRAGIGELWQAYLRRFPRAVRRELRADPRRRKLSFLASQMTDRDTLAVSLDRLRAKLVVKFDDGTPDMPCLLPGMKWQTWK